MLVLLVLTPQVLTPHVLQHVAYACELALAAGFMSGWVEFVKRARQKAFLIRLLLSDARVSSFRNHGTNPIVVDDSKRAGGIEAVRCRGRTALWYQSLTSHLVSDLSPQAV